MDERSKPEASARRFATNSLIYLLPNVLVRGLSFLLTPVYAQAMSPDDYGIVGLTSTLVTLLGIFLGFALYNAVGRLYIDCATDEAKRQFVGTMSIALLVAPPICAGALDLAGTLGLLDGLTSLSFEPYLRLVIWIALLSVYSPFATALLTICEEPKAIAILNIATALVQIAATLVFVVVLRQGALGVLCSTAVGSAVGAVASIALLASRASMRFDWNLLRRAIAYSLPLLPHLLANWAFAVSDRLILERHVSHEVIGHYSMAYLFAFVTSMVVSAILSAFSPVAQKTLLAHGDTTPELRRLSTIVIGIFTFGGLGAALLGPDAILLLTPDSYHPATIYVGWVVVGALLQGVALVVAQVTWFMERTGLVAMITMIAAVVNVSANLLLVPVFGAPAAAWTTAAGGVALLLAHVAIGHSLRPLQWPYRAWLLTTGVGLACYVIGEIGAARWDPWMAAGFHAAVVVFAFPLGLTLAGVVAREQWRALLPARAR